ncbi:putative sensor domain DACNV-containing protein [uncultured Desulfobulbus sp.]|uniref:putative sensor domain DACNV-containing protein n=1 Tax=uncultured Desulfobulbus sp. TaxID=239745 RepID=UPI002D1E460F|nr:hypothetical protein [uncultured Desulfobulbus sp.]
MFSEELLINLFEIMYFASIKTEESQKIIFNIVYLESNNPELSRPTKNVADRWGFVKFDKQIQFTISNVIKLAKASDPRSSSIAINHNDDDQIMIFGLIDQGDRYNDYVNFESETRPERPGIFQASIDGQGTIVAYIHYEKIAELKINKLIRSTEPLAK